MDGFVEIPAGNILEEGKHWIPGFFDIPYIVYVSLNDLHRNIRNNTRCFPQGEKVRLNVRWDRGLCRTIEEYRRLSRKDVEAEACGAWMDGAR